MQPRKYSKKNFKTELQEKLKIAYEELGGLSDPGVTGLCT
jgi:hypothetical protein